MALQRNIKLGTRGSPLALAQANHVRDLLSTHTNMAPEQIEITVMKTTGDRFTDRPLSAIGGKGLFTKELEEGLFSGEIDLAVHSTKDVATILPSGLILTAFLPREDPRDAFISHKYESIDALPIGAVVGTSSLRRKSQLLHKRPDLEVVEFRGSVQTRMEKLEAGCAEATFLAMAGLRRLGQNALIGRIAHPIPVDKMLPAVAQGAISIEIRNDDQDMAELLAFLNDEKTSFAVEAERTLLRELDGSCRTPIAGYFDGKTLRGEVLSLDGAKILRAKASVETRDEDASSLGKSVARDLLDQGAESVLA